jgi:hypothetical protein
MTNQLTYQGDRTTDLLAQVEDGHLFGPDLCGTTRWAYKDLGWAMSTGFYAALAGFRQSPMPAGAFYELAEAEYDFEANVTVAKFRPHVDPRSRIRYHGGDAELENQPILEGRDRVDAH